MRKRPLNTAEFPPADVTSVPAAGDAQSGRPQPLFHGRGKEKGQSELCISRGSDSREHGKTASLRIVRPSHGRRRGHTAKTLKGSQDGWQSSQERAREARISGFLDPSPCHNYSMAATNTEIHIVNNATCHEVRLLLFSQLFKHVKTTLSWQAT